LPPSKNPFLVNSFDPFVVNSLKPFVMSLSNHAFRGKVKVAVTGRIAPRAWFGRLTTNGILEKFKTTGIHRLPQNECRT